MNALESIKSMLAIAPLLVLTIGFTFSTPAYAGVDSFFDITVDIADKSESFLVMIIVEDDGLVIAQEVEIGADGTIFIVTDGVSGPVRNGRALIERDMLVDGQLVDIKGSKKKKKKTNYVGHVTLIK